ncbi:hypothetical protein A2U01_0019913, partial [Trifolium medium]|nr:hypothetical protein [Trifolium medium]
MELQPSVPEPPTCRVRKQSFNLQFTLAPSSVDFVLLSTGGCALWEWIESDA